MTRREFEDDVTLWSELIDFCYDNGCGYCDCIYCEDSYNDSIQEELREVVDDWSWQEVYDWLRDLPDGCDYYVKDSYGEWGSADGAFDDYKYDVLEWGDENNVWDEEEEEEPEEQYVEPEEEVVDEDISMDELFVPQVFEIIRKPKEETTEEENAEEDEDLLEELFAV